MASVFDRILITVPQLSAAMAQMARTLAERGVAVSEIRDGRKPGTRVATIKSHCLQIPTLLIEPVT